MYMHKTYFAPFPFMNILVYFDKFINSWQSNNPRITQFKINYNNGLNLFLTLALESNYFSIWNFVLEGG